MKNLEEIISIKEIPEDNNELLALIKNAINSAATSRTEIEKLKKAKQTNSKHKTINTNKKEIKTPIETTNINDEKDDIADITSLYYEDYAKLPYDFTEEDLISILPVRNNIHFNNIIMKLHAESFKTINDIFEYIKNLDSNSKKEEKNELTKMLEHEKRKITLLKNISTQKDKINTETIKKNKIVLIQRSSGNIIPISDLDEIPAEFYPQLYDLIESLIDGTFKGIKLLKSNYRLKKVYELKSDQLRVVFNKLDKNTYAIIAVFLKKINRDTYYVDFINTRAYHYNAIRADIVNNLNNPDFIKMNEENVAKFFNIINPIETTKKYTKTINTGDINE